MTIRSHKKRPRFFVHEGGSDLRAVATVIHRLADNTRLPLEGQPLEHDLFTCFRMNEWTFNHLELRRIKINNLTYCNLHAVVFDSNVIGFRLSHCSENGLSFNLVLHFDDTITITGKVANPNYCKVHSNDDVDHTQRQNLVGVIL